MASIASNNSLANLRSLAPRFVERIWGTTRLSPWFPDQEEKTGEVWFTDDGSLLVKFIFTEADLSVQVHPNNQEAQSAGQGSRGKTEMWHILGCEPGARLAIGLNNVYRRTEVDRAIHEERLEALMQYVPVRPGETYFVPAGTIHAIGAGITLCEIQQNSDITYRLYDYGRGRELHVEQGLAVSRFEPYDARVRFPVKCDHFLVESVKTELLEAEAGDLLILLEGSGRLNGEAAQHGSVWRVESAGAVEITGTLRALRARGEA